MLATDTGSAIRTPRTTALLLKLRKMALHGDQHDMRILQTQMTFRLGLVQRALPLGISLQRILAIRMTLVGNRTIIPTLAHRHRIDNRDIAGTVTLRITGNIQHEKAVLETRVMRNIRLLLQSLQQSKLRLRPFVEQTVGRRSRVTAIAITAIAITAIGNGSGLRIFGRRAFIAYGQSNIGTGTNVDSGQIENQLIAENRILRRNAERKTRLTVSVAGSIIILLVTVIRLIIGRTGRRHIHEFETDVDDVHTSRINARGFYVYAHNRVNVATGKMGITPIRLPIIRQTTFKIGTSPIARSPESGIMVEHSGTAGTGDAAQIRAGHGIVAGTFLTVLGFASSRTFRRDISGTILNIVDPHTFRRPQNGNGQAPFAFLGNRPQSHPDANLTQQRDFVAQTTIRIGKRARQSVGCDQTVEILHENGIALRDYRFKLVTNGKIVPQ